MSTEELQLISTIGFEGKVNNGLIVHPNKKHIIYPLGSTVVVKEVGGAEGQTFLQGHTDRVSCVAVSKSGRFVASGQITHMGFKADIIVWDFEQRSILFRMNLHKVKVEALVFSPGETFLASLGGPDDNSMVIWDLATGQAVCGSPASRDSAGNCHAFSFFAERDDMLVSGGNSTIRVWEIDLHDRKLRPTDINSRLKRIITTVCVEKGNAYLGTTSGDILQLNLKTHLISNYGPTKSPLVGGITCIALNDSTGDIIAGSGDGTITICKKDTFKVVRSTKLMGVATSVSFYDNEYLFAGTDQSNIYFVSFNDMKSELRNACHNDKINDVAFPYGYSELFVTACKGDVRVWNSRTLKELLRIQVPNLECNCAAFFRDGTGIISGWSDGRIRVFYPQSGKLMYVINDAHPKGVTAVAATSDCRRIISGGNDGSVRVWSVSKEKQVMETSMKEHKGAVSSIQVKRNDSECVSSSADGSTIIWDLHRFVRLKCFFASTFFKSVAYHPDENQILTTGTDRKLCYWDVYDGSLIREMEGSASGVMNTLSINDKGVFFLSGGSDRLLKLWAYDEGVCTHVGVGHSGSIMKARISPDQKFAVSVGDEGAVFVWRLP
eukprot:TRINITY_DN253_c0_g1_i1.p1 TRINITY_DN253_c0_g1~~TRINITY_DN253_c0_g1_i1.p1  ORF type:complete len:608 (-),score=132.32 TRINITY_DN253_c0_g1_i1:424-2247(-)